MTLSVWTHASFGVVLLVALVQGSYPDHAHASNVDLGGIVISVSESRTAQTFHVVDQLSEWDPACHRQYGRWAAKALNL